MINRELIEKAVQDFGPINSTSKSDALHFNGSSDQQLARVNRIGSGGEYTAEENSLISKYAKLLNEYRSSHN